jgi:RNA processing factor Prp31
MVIADIKIKEYDNATEFFKENWLISKIINHFEVNINEWDKWAENELEETRSYASLINFILSSGGCDEDLINEALVISDKKYILQYIENNHVDFFQVIEIL